MKGEVKMNSLHLNMLVGGVGGSGTGETGRGRIAGGWERQGPIETSRAIPTHGGASRTDFAKVSPGQGGAGEVHPLGTGGAL